MGSSAPARGPGPAKGPSPRPQRRPSGGGWASHPRLWLPLLPLLTALLPPTAAFAGPITTVLKEASIQGAQATFNNSWSQSFTASGDSFAAGGAATIQPFATAPADSRSSAPATYLHAVVELQPGEAKARATAVAGYAAQAGRDDGQGGTPGITALSGQANGLSALGLAGRPGPELETISGQVDGLNIGTESLSVFGQTNGIPARQATVQSLF